MSASIKQLPLWFRYLVAVIVGAVLVVAFVLFVTHHQQPLSESAANPSRQQQAAELAQDRQVTIQEQAPHRVTVASLSSATAAAEAVLTAHMTAQISSGLISGPLDSPAACTATGSGSAASVRSATALRCNAVAGDRSQNAGLRYPFDVVVDPRAGTVTYCQVVTPPYPLKPLPVSAACR